MRLLLAIVLLLACTAAADPVRDDFRDDARALAALIDHQYAYPERLPGGRFALTPTLAAEADRVHDRRTLIRFAERALTLLADHHAITGASLADSWAVFPSYGDLWVESRGSAFVIEQVRVDSPAAGAGIAPGDRLIAVDGIAVSAAVATFWTDIGITGDRARDGHAARVLAAGRRDRPRSLTVQRGNAAPRVVTLPSLYAADAAEPPPISARRNGDRLVIRFNDSLGRDDAVAAFDRAMAAAPTRARIVLDLTDTPSGGNTNVARGIMGWFATRPTAYQIHELPVEERDTGIARRWIEQVLPRTGLVVKLPTERLYAVDGTPREAFVPARAR